MVRWKADSDREGPLRQRHRPARPLPLFRIRWVSEFPSFGKGRLVFPEVTVVFWRRTVAQVRFLPGLHLGFRPPRQGKARRGSVVFGFHVGPWLVSCEP